MSPSWKELTTEEGRAALVRLPSTETTTTTAAAAAAAAAATATTNATTSGTVYLRSREKRSRNDSETALAEVYGLQDGSRFGRLDGGRH